MKAFFTLTTYLALVPLLTILYVVIRLRSRDFESVVVTEGRIVITKGSKTVADHYFSDCELKVHPKKNRSGSISMESRQRP